MGSVLEVEGRFAAVGGLNLFYRGWEAENARAALLIIHGLAEHGGRYAEFGRRMAAAGISVYACDLRGHGLSDGRRGHADRFELLLHDVDRFRREIEGCVAELPLFLLGHSMGGLVGVRYIEEYEAGLRGAIIVSPWLATVIPVPRWKKLLAAVLNRVLPSLPFAAGIDPDRLSHDPVVVGRYRDDPLVHGRITPRLFAEVSKAMELAEQRSDRIRIPLLVLLAGDDRLVDSRKSEAFARSLTAADVTIHVLPDYYHEVLNDHNRVLAANQVHDWLLARLP